MRNQEIIITIAILAVLAYFYWQSRRENLNALSPENDTKLKDLQSQVNHYQTLYQKRVEKDLDAEALNSEWETRYSQLENLNNQTNREKIKIAKYQELLEKKTEDLENQLVNLAKQKIKGKKEAEKLLEELETQWKQDKENWAEEKTAIFKNYTQEQEKQKQIIQDLEQNNQEQLRKINVLFDPNSVNYETIDFNGLYSLLQQIAERERERESNLTPPIYSRQRKKKPWEKK